MPILKPQNDSAGLIEDKVTEIAIANELLKEAGREDLALKNEGLTALLDEVGLGLKDTLKELKVIQTYADNEGVKLSAVRTSLELHRVLGKQDQVSDKPITINILGSSSANLQLNSILNPQRNS
jgi:hypothetical protein